jgi:hypothetical protein
MNNENKSGTPSNETAADKTADKNNKQTQEKKPTSAKKGKLPSRTAIPAEYRAPLGEIQTEIKKATGVKVPVETFIKWGLDLKVVRAKAQSLITTLKTS